MRVPLAAGLLLLMAGAVLTLDRAFPPDLSRAQTLSPELRDSTNRVLNLRAASDGAIRLAPEAVSDDVTRLLIAREDRRFWDHPGVDPAALLRAAAQFAWHGRIVSGGSTIAMQVAHMLEPHPRTLTGKLHDIFRAIQLQAHLGRAEVLRLYLTLAPMGGNIESVRAASLLYFGREPAALTRSQAALLVALPQSPTKRRPDRHPDLAWRAANRVLAAAGDTEPAAPEPVARAPTPSLARHLAQHFTGRTDATLDGALQKAIEALARREIVWFGADADLAAVVVRNQDRAILGYVGGTQPSGMIDMVRATRSPGSALKPFIYAMAFDDGLATPGTWLDDGAIRLGTYAPRDFDRTEHGPTTAADALRQSLNRPAVRLLARLGPARFAASLDAYLRLPRGGNPSAALALGGAGITMLDLAGLYADLADGGTRGTPYVRAPEPPRNGALMSPHAAELVATILRQQPPPPGVAADPAHPIAYKTGTSYGFRDAWACGFTPGYTVIVWVGRRDGAPRPGATGRDTAAPMLFRIFALLPPEATPQDAAVQTASLAPALRRMTPRASLRIVFPPDNVDLSYDPSAPVDLRATGGKPPYQWTADGVPLPSPLWTAPQLGFVHLTVTDRDGRYASSDVRLLPE